MPWFRIDDGFHCHPKVFAAGTPAIGLYVRCGSWAAQQSSEGIVPKQVARLYGTPRMIKALIDAGLWHASGHDCESCPQLDANSYVFHQFLERNPSRVEVESVRKLKSARQQKWREGKRNAQANQGAPEGVDVDVDASPPGHGDAAPTPTPSLPFPSTSYGGTSSSLPSSEPGRLPVVAGAREVEEAEHPEIAQLIAAMRAQGMGISWRLEPEEWLQLREKVQRVGVGALVEHAARVWRAAKDTPYSARYFLPGWLTLKPAPEGPHGGLRAVGGPSKTNDYLADMAAIADELRQEGQTGS